MIYSENVSKAYTDKDTTQLVTQTLSVLGAYRLGVTLSQKVVQVLGKPAVIIKPKHNPTKFVENLLATFKWEQTTLDLIPVAIAKVFEGNTESLYGVLLKTEDGMYLSTGDTLLISR